MTPVGPSDQGSAQITFIQIQIREIHLRDLKFHDCLAWPVKMDPFFLGCLKKWLFLGDVFFGGFCNLIRNLKFVLFFVNQMENSLVLFAFVFLVVVRK